MATTTPTTIAIVPAAQLEAGMQVGLDGAIRWIFEATPDGDSMRLRIDGYTGHFTIPATWEYAVYTPITPTRTPAAELEAGMQVWLDGAIRWIFEATPDGDSMRLRIEGFTSHFTIPATWEYAAYIAPAARVA